MEWIRRRPRVAAVSGVVAVLAVLTLVFVMSGSEDTGPNVAPDLGDLSTIAPLEPEPTLPEAPSTPSASASTPTAAEVQAATRKQFKKLGQGYTGGGLDSGSLEMPGLSGGSIYQYLPKHKIVMKVTSSAPIGTVGYVVPTSLNESNGVVRNVGQAWSLTTTVYGDPDYAQLFMQSDARGHAITCTITVDGKVTEKRSTEGPYARLICQG